MNICHPRHGLLDYSAPSLILATANMDVISQLQKILELRKQRCHHTTMIVTPYLQSLVLQCSFPICIQVWIICFLPFPNAPFLLKVNHLHISSCIPTNPAQGNWSYSDCWKGTRSKVVKSTFWGSFPSLVNFSLTYFPKACTIMKQILKVHIGNNGIIGLYGKVDEGFEHINTAIHHHNNNG
jgi:hypothetical protein